jgi:hypothetical protein
VKAPDSIENIRNDCLWNKRRCYHLHLDKLAEEFIRDHGAEPSFPGYMDFQISLYESKCTSRARNSNNTLKVYDAYQWLQAIKHAPLKYASRSLEIN